MLGKSRLLFVRELGRSMSGSHFMCDDASWKGDLYDVSTSFRKAGGGRRHDLRLRFPKRLGRTASCFLPKLWSTLEEKEAIRCRCAVGWCPLYYSSWKVNSSSAYGNGRSRCPLALK